MIDQACRLKESKERIAQLESRQKKIAELLQTAHASLAQKDQHIKELEEMLKMRHDKDITLGWSVTKVVKAIFGKRLLYEPFIMEMTIL